MRPHPSRRAARRYGLLAWLGLSLALCALSCRQQSAGTVLPIPTVSQTAPAPEPPPPPPPPLPKCESLSEACKAEEKTRVEIQASGVAYTPPLGWTYASGADHSRTVEASGAASVSFAISESESTEDVLAAVEKLGGTMALGNLKLDRLKKRLKKPQHKLEGDSGAIELWEVTAGNQGGKAPTLDGKGAGTALVALARVATERLVVVLGFVVEPDEQGQAAKIMQAVNTLSVKK